METAAAQEKEGAPDANMDAQQDPLANSGAQEESKGGDVAAQNSDFEQNKEKQEST